MTATGEDRPTGGVASCGIAVMAKASLPGRTKTRLVPPLTFPEAAALNTAFLKDVAHNILAAARHASIAGYMAYGPPESAFFFRENVPNGFGMFEAWSPNFGDCLHGAVRELLHRSHESAIVLNSDSPTLPTALLLQAADLLARPGDRAVLGPAIDGGYYLLGLKKAHRRLFEAVDWSTSRVAEQTLGRTRELALEVHVLAPWYDVDDAHSLIALDSELTSEPSFEAAFQPYQAAHTAELLRSLHSTHGFADRLRASAPQHARQMSDIHQFTAM